MRGEYFGSPVEVPPVEPVKPNPEGSLLEINEPVPQPAAPRPEITTPLPAEVSPDNSAEATAVLTPPVTEEASDVLDLVPKDSAGVVDLEQVVIKMMEHTVDNS